MATRTLTTRLKKQFKHIRRLPRAPSWKTFVRLVKLSRLALASQQIRPSWLKSRFWGSSEKLQSVTGRVSECLSQSIAPFVAFAICLTSEVDCRRHRHRLYNQLPALLYSSIELTYNNHWYTSAAVTYMLNYYKKPANWRVIVWIQIRRKLKIIILTLQKRPFIKESLNP